MNLDTIVCADALELMATLPDASIDMVLCDLPYGTLETGWDNIIPFAPMWEQFKRVAKSDIAIVLSGKPPFSAMLLASNPSMYRYSWYWHKARGANVAQTSFRPLAVIEEILVFSPAPAVYQVGTTIRYYPQKEPLDKPYKRSVLANHSSVVADRLGSPMRNPEKGIGLHEYTHATPRNLLYFVDDTERGLHPTQKPTVLFEYLIRTYTQPDEIVLDCCIGSGTTAIAARNTGRHFIGCDSSPEYVELANKRLAKPWQPGLLEG